MDITFELIEYAVDQEREDEIWGLWKLLYPQMQSGMMNFMPYSDFKAKHNNAKCITHKTEEEIEEEMLKVVSSYKSGVK